MTTVHEWAPSSLEEAVDWLEECRKDVSGTAATMARLLTIAVDAARQQPPAPGAQAALYKAIDWVGETEAAVWQALEALRDVVSRLEVQQLEEEA